MMIINIIARIIIGLMLLLWWLSFEFANKHKVWEMVFDVLSLSIFFVGFVESFLNVIGL